MTELELIHEARVDIVESIRAKTHRSITSSMAKRLNAQCVAIGHDTVFEDPNFNYADMPIPGIP